MVFLDQLDDCSEVADWIGQVISLTELSEHTDRLQIISTDWLRWLGHLTGFSTDLLTNSRGNQDPLDWLYGLMGSTGWLIWGGSLDWTDCLADWIDWLSKWTESANLTDCTNLSYWQIVELTGWLNWLDRLAFWPTDLLTNCLDRQESTGLTVWFNRYQLDDWSEVAHCIGQTVWLNWLDWLTRWANSASVNDYTKLTDWQIV